MENYYDILGVAPSAGEAELKRAYRRLARELHPDVNKASGAEARFKAVGEAYDVLKDARTRALYDRFGEDWRKAEEAERQGVSPDDFARFRHRDFAARDGTRSQGFTGAGTDQQDIEEILRDLFGRARSGGRWESAESARWQSRAAPGFAEPAPTVHELPVTLQELWAGSERLISLQTGTSSAVQTKQLKVRIPQGMTDGSVIRLGGKGGGGGLDRELRIRLVVEPDPLFRVDGYNLKTTLPVSFLEAMLGAKVPVQFPGGQARLTIPAGSGSGRVFRLRGKGLKRRDGGAGDLLVCLEVTVPEHLSEQERELLKKLEQISTFAPRRNGQRATVR